ncbi:MAG: hypothetical protein ACK2TV_15785 [Anaerolineales bacterium]
MKNPKRIRILGYVLIVLSILGLLFSIVGFVGPWFIRLRAESALKNIISLVSNTLLTTDDAMRVLDNTLGTITTDVSIIEDTFSNLEDTIDGISSSIDKSSKLIGDDLRLTIINTQTALSSAASSAAIIDKTLSFLDKVPLLGVDYQPEVPLNISLEQAADSMDGIPVSLESMEQDLGETASGLLSLNSNISDLADNLSELEDNIFGARDVLRDYREIIADVQVQISHLSRNLELYLIILLIFITGFFFWLGLAQAHILLQGLDFVRSEQEVVNLADIKRE